LIATRGYIYGGAPLVLGNIRSPNYYNEDFAILKSTTIHENHEIDFKVDIPNAFNRHIFGTLDGWSVTTILEHQRPKGRQRHSEYQFHSTL